MTDIRTQADCRELTVEEIAVVSGGNLVAAGMVVAAGIAGAYIASELYLAYLDHWYAQR